MRVLIVHNAYQQRGGEDHVVADEAAMLTDAGHDVRRFEAHNDAVRGLSPLRLAAGTIWSASSHRTLRAAIREQSPNVLHVHNTLPLLSPSVYYAARAEGVPVVQTVHNYRLVCPGALLSRGGRVCRDCVGRHFAWPGVAHGCYRASRAATGVVALMLAAHHVAGTWRRLVGVYIAPSEFVRRQLVAGGLPASRIVVKPHVVFPDRGAGAGGDYAAFVGRLSPEKGLGTLLAAWDRLFMAPPLIVVGDGPLAPMVAEAAEHNRAVTAVGAKSPDEVHAILRGARAVVIPSESPESFGRVAAEAFAAGTPVIASSIGALTEIVEDGVSGLLYHTGDADDLARQVDAAFGDNGFVRMREAARAAYEHGFSARTNLRALLAIYARVRNVRAPLARRARRGTRPLTTARRSGAGSPA